MKVLNLYSGLLGNREKWEDVDVTNVELEDSLIEAGRKRKPNDTFIKADAHQYLLDHHHEFDFIWSSPPCPSHSRMMKATRHKLRRYPDMSLYQEEIFLDHFFKGKWVVENVKPYYEPLIKPTAIIGRHYFWSNFQIDEKGYQGPDQPKGFITSGTVKETEMLKDWLGIHYEGNIYHKGNHCPGQVLRNCVHPELGLYILEQAQGIIRQEKTSQIKLFNTDAA
jgi:DNA (cytosine-5)-methyltransferase 1